MSIIRANSFQFLDSGKDITYGDVEAVVDSVSELQSSSVADGVNRIWLSGYYGQGTPGGGPLYYDPGDTTTADNGGTVFVDSNGARWKRPETGYISLSEFGIVADSDGTTGNGTDNTAQMEELGAWASGRNGYVVTGPNGIVRFKATSATNKVVLPLTGSHGFEWLLGGTELFDDSDYDQANDERSTLLKLEDCNRHRFVINVDSENITQGEGGMRSVWAEKSCHNIDVYGSINGGSSFFHATKSRDTDPESYRSSMIYVRCDAENTDQPVNFNFSGDQSRADIKAVNTGRPFYIDNARDVGINLIVDSQNKAATINAWDGDDNVAGCENISVRWHQKSGGDYPSAGILCYLQWNYTGTSGARNRNIDLEFNIENPPSASPWAHVLRFDKRDSGTTGVTTDRGHSLDGLSVRAYGDMSNASNLTTTTGARFAGSETVKGIDVGPISIAGTGTNAAFSFFENGTVEDIAYFHNVKANSLNFENKAVFVACDIRETDTAGAEQTIIGSTVRSDAVQSTKNKTFVDTTLGGNPAYSEQIYSQSLSIKGKNGNRVFSQPITNYRNNVASGSGQTFDTGIEGAYAYTQQVIVNFKDDGNALMDWSVRIFNISQANASEIDFEVASQDNSGGMDLTSLSLTRSANDTIEVNADFSNDGTLAVSVS